MSEIRRVEDIDAFFAGLRWAWREWKGSGRDMKGFNGMLRDVVEEFKRENPGWKVDPSDIRLVRAWVRRRQLAALRRGVRESGDCGGVA
jgi:hypothetical protein